MIKSNANIATSNEFVDIKESFAGTLMKLKKPPRIVTVGITTVAIIVLIAAGALILGSYPDTSTLTPVSITDVNVVYSGILYVAEDQGYFTKNGLNVTFQDYPNAEAGFNALENGEVDFAQSAEYTIVGEIFDNKDIQIVATIDKADVMALICRPDHGIQNPLDLAGKKIAVGEGTIREFYLGRYLNLKGISIQDVNVVYLSLQESVEALANGTVDAVVVPDAVWYNQVMAEIDRAVVAFPIQEGQPVFTVLACRSNYTASNPETVTKLLKALYEAEAYIANHPTQAEAIVQNRLNMTSLDLGWSNYRFSLSLGLPLVTAMRDEAQWIINNNLTNKTQVPDFMNYIYTDALKLVKPYSVTIDVGG